MKILGYHYSIERQQGDFEFNYMGFVNAKDHKIIISADVCIDQQISTILHEIIEALDYHLELCLDHQTIMLLEAGLYQTLKDNGISLEPLADELTKGDQSPKEL